jgi:hypothetical protein
MHPLDVIASPNWKITLPEPGAPEIVMPRLKTYESQWFYLLPDNTSVVFKCPTNGGTTKNSKNPRSELREMRDNGADEAEWNSGSGQHSMVVDLAITHLPTGGKPHVVVAQVHDADDDMTVFRLEDKALWITDGDSTHGYRITDSYQLGTRIQVGFQINNGAIGYTFNGQPVSYAQNKKKSGCYFKTGCYNNGGEKKTDRLDDYAEVVLYSVQVCHDGVCSGKDPGTAPAEPPPVEPTLPPQGQPTLQDVLDGLDAQRALLERLSAHLGVPSSEHRA